MLNSRSPKPQGLGVHRGQNSSASQAGFAGQPLVVVIAAIFIAALAIGSYVYFNPKPAGPTGEVEQTWVYPIHSDSSIGGGLGAAAAVKQPFDQILVLAKVKISNPSKIPVFIHDMSAMVTLPNDETRNSLAAGTSDFKQVFVAYPQMAANKQAPLLRDTAIDPGTSAEGLTVFNYPLTKEKWDTHSALNLTISFAHQDDIVLKAPNPSQP